MSSMEAQENSDFTLDEYKRLLEMAARKYEFVQYDEVRMHPVVCWRHDVVYSPQRALVMAEIEAEHSLKCIYHLFLHSHYYNVFAPSTLQIFRRIGELGHVLGLHFDVEASRDDGTSDQGVITEYIGAEKRILDNLLNQPLRSVSFHNYVMSKDRIPKTHLIHGMVNVCSHSIWEEYKYVSDSNGIWRHDSLAQVLGGETHDRLHVLTHPVWWTSKNQVAIERLKEAVCSQASDGIDLYIDLLKKDERYEEIADQIGIKRYSLGSVSTVAHIEEKANGEGELGRRFEFGRNWARFVKNIDMDRVYSAVASMQKFLQEESLEGYHFLDIGCGSGLSSLAAYILGAEVHAFDSDNESVETARRLLESSAEDLNRWVVEQGSVLDAEYMESLPLFDIVYAWGVLHHTGAMWKALELASAQVKPEGKLAIALYNDQGGSSRRWSFIKRLYVKSPRLIRALILISVGLFFELRAAAIRALRFQNPLPFKDWRARRYDRGMSVYHDLVDWVGGYPFEVAKPEEVLDFLRVRGFYLQRLKTCGGGHGCNEYLFVRNARGGMERV